jgi:hypothetical protein
MGPSPRLHSAILSLGFRRALPAQICFGACALLLLAGAFASAQAQVINTVAGGFNPSTAPSENYCEPIRAVANFESPDATLRFFTHRTYYSALVVNPPVLFRDRPVPSLKSPVLLLDGGGLSLAVVDHACYTLGTDGKWAAAGASAVQSAAAMQ